MAKKSWLCREDNGNYVVGLVMRPRLFFRKGCWFQKNGRFLTMCDRDFEREFPNVKGRLKPGEDPVLVEFTMRFCDE